MLFTPSSVRPGSSSGTVSLTDGLELDIEKRLSIVERAIRLQMALGATHLQQIEKGPAAFGVPTNARSSVRQLRRERNRALHGVEPRSSDITAAKARHSDIAAAKEFHGRPPRLRNCARLSASTPDGRPSRRERPIGSSNASSTASNLTGGELQATKPLEEEATNSSCASAHSEAENEESMDEIPKGEMLADPLYQVRVSRGGCNGSVELIETGSFTKERLYRVLYDDGDVEHVTAQDAARGHSEFLDALVLTWG